MKWHKKLSSNFIAGWLIVGFLLGIAGALLYYYSSH